MNYQYLDTPIGRLRLVSNGNALVRIAFAGQYAPAAHERAVGDAALTAAAQQLHEYFCGRRRRFELPLAAPGTPFQHLVWDALRDIPYGQLRSYGDIARRIGRASAARAVGAANGRNPLPIVVPCHRVVGSDGRLTGFAGGLDTKAALLRLEGAAAG
ncbi:MAG: cysteine methyltransferase [Halioglobus sp.]|nr:cysteine methyltransferase [Halioglobus sp.]|tara:strand:+ start:340 stop:810 length:471 start_codon:yes stop_codon:yes gene_type:complete